MNAFKRRKLRDAVLFSVPGFLIFTIFMLLPIFLSFYYSFTNWSGGDVTFIGLKNFREMFTSSEYHIAIKNTFFFVALSLFVKVPIAAVLAFLLYRTVRGYKVFRTVIFLPVIIAPIAIGMMFSILLNADIGPVGQFFRNIGLKQFDIVWLSNPKYVLWAVCIPQIWSNIGLHVTLFLAGMQSVSEDVIESAKIDGATSGIIFRKIMLPLITEISQVSIIMTITGALKSFGIPWAMTTGGPGNASTFFSILMFTKAFEESRFGYASAVSIMILFYGMMFTVAFKWIYKKLLGD